MAPEEEALYAPILAVAWDASFSSLAFSCFCSPAVYLAALAEVRQRYWKGGAYLIRRTASKATKSRLDCSSSRVDVGLDSGGLLVGHDCGWLVDWFVCVY